MRRNQPNPFQIHPLWWLGQVGLILMGSLFLVFGVQLLMAAYDLPDPFTFIMTFFAASLVILISLALLVGFLLRLWSVYNHLKAPPPKVSSEPKGKVEAPIPDGEKPAKSPER